MDHSFSIPIVFIIFNRPDTTQQVFEEIRKIRPSKLYIIADGPRLHVSTDAERCAQCRQIIEMVDWPCEVTKDYSGSNLGCAVRVATGLDNAFKKFDKLIVLEDDCLPDPTFFPYCEELLNRYEHTPEVLHITGTNCSFGAYQGRESYYFSKYAHVWGWASWRRAWKHYDLKMRDWPEFSKEGLSTIVQSRGERQFFERVCNGLYTAEKPHTWDFQLTFSVWNANGYSIIPKVNLISNIGFHAEATHTKKEDSHLSRIPVAPMVFPLIHPTKIERCCTADMFVARDQYYRRNLWDKLVRKFKKWFREKRKSESVL